MAILYTTLQTPRGRFLVKSSGNPPCSVDPAGTLSTSWVGPAWVPPASWVLDRQLLPETVDLLRAYFAGADVDPVDAPLPTPTGSAFQQRCWLALRRVGRGKRVTYGQLAVLAGGDQRQARAVGAAMRANPLPVIVPCHRVVAQDGQKQRLGGYMGASERHASDDHRLQIKRWLLELEADIVPTGLSTEKLACG